MIKNAYIHIPFCKSKCNYCSFVSYPTLELKEGYLNALISQIKIEYKGESMETLYFGGGTPSILSVTEFEKLLSMFNLAKDAEITAEINPEGVDEDYLRGLKKVGINRISIGSQTLDDKILKTIGRRHNSQRIKDVVNKAKAVGFGNLSLDLIYGLPEQNLVGFEKDLKTVVDLNVQHVSLYGLKIEEGCYFYKNLPNALPDSDLQADMYLKAIEMLKNAGFEHYEISNFAKKGFESKHNLNYWQNNTYYGFGCSASGYIYPPPQPSHLKEGGSIRYTNESALKKYIANPTEKSSQDVLSNQEILEEAIFLGLRKMSGINIQEINDKFGIDFEQKYSKIIDQYLKTGHLIQTEKGYALSVDGILVSNEILAEFIDC